MDCQIHISKMIVRRIVIVRECAASESRKRKRSALCADLDLNLREEFHVGFSVRVVDESVGLPGYITEEEDWRLVAIRTPLGPSHVVQE
jgi:hypothetical protein